MSSTKGSRKLSTAFDNFRAKSRKTRIDSLLSPPELSGASGAPSSIDWDDVPLREGEKSALDCRAEHVEFALPSETDATADSEFDNDLSEDRRVVAALGDFQAGRVESSDIDEDIGAFFQEGERKEEEDEPLPKVTIDESLSPTHLTPYEETEIGIPLERQGFRTYQTQVQTEPQTVEQTAIQTSRATFGTALDKIAPRQTVDGVRLDGRPIIRHSGTAAPPQTKPLCSPSTNHKHYGRVSAEEHLGIEERHAPYPSTSKQTATVYPLSSSTSSLSDPTIDIGIATVTDFYIPPSRAYRVDSASASAATRQAPRPPIAYSHTPPPTHTQATLSSIQNVQLFHTDLCARLRRSIDGGEVRACQISVRERVRRVSEGLGESKVARGVKKMGKGVENAVTWAGEGVMASGAVGVRWDRVAESADSGRKGYGDVYAVGYGAGFV